LDLPGASRSVSSESESWPSLEQAARTLGGDDAWTQDPMLARRSAATLQRGLESDAWAQQSAHATAADALLAHPPRKWFLFKRGTFFGTSQLLVFLICVCARDHAAATDPDVRKSSDPVQTGSIEVLDRLIRHVEVRRGDALEFVEASVAADDDALTERMRFALALIEASTIFADLRYLNTAMKLVDAALVELRKERLQPGSTRSLRRHLAYLVAFSAQESVLTEVRMC
jgi:hypothetical protein